VEQAKFQFDWNMDNRKVVPGSYTEHHPNRKQGNCNRQRKLITYRKRFRTIRLLLANVDHRTPFCAVVHLAVNAVQSNALHLSCSHAQGT
jgi:hypothetical protein